MDKSPPEAEPDLLDQVSKLLGVWPQGYEEHCLFEETLAFEPLRYQRPIYERFDEGTGEEFVEWDWNMEGSIAHGK